MHGERVHDDEHHADQTREEDVHERGDEALRVGPDLLKLAECFAAALVLEDLKGEGQRMPDPIGVQLCAQPLRYDIDEVVLEILGDARDECDPDGKPEQEHHATKELSVGVVLEFQGIVVDDVPEDERIEQREDLIDRGKQECQCDERPVAAQVSK